MEKLRFGDVLEYDTFKSVQNNYGSLPILPTAYSLNTYSLTT